MPFVVRSALHVQTLSVCLLAVAGCGGGSPGGGDECEPLVDACPAVETQSGDYAQFCAASEFFAGGVCTNVCEVFSNQVGSGNEGDFCVFDDDCGSGLTCDNDTVGAEMPCRCIVDEGGNNATDCTDVTPGNGEFGAPCRNDGDCLDGLPCCTSTAVSEACGVEVGLCECI